MPFLTNRILRTKYIDSSGFANTLASIADDPKSSNGLSNVPGESLYVTDGTYTLSFRYVQLDTVANLGALVANAPVYYTDSAQRTVNSDPTKAKTYVVSTDSSVESAAGLILNKSATGTQGVWIQTAGYLENIPAPSGATLGDRLVLSNAAGTAPTINVFTRVAAGTAPGTPEAMGVLYVVALTSIVNTLVNGWIHGTCGLP